MKSNFLLIVFLFSFFGFNSTFSMTWEMKLTIDYPAQVSVYHPDDLTSPIYTYSSSTQLFWDVQLQSGSYDYLEGYKLYTFRIINASGDRCFNLYTGFGGNNDFVIEYTNGTAYHVQQTIYTRNITLYGTLAWVPPLSVNIDGPSSLRFKQAGIYTAYASGGSGSYTYYWETDRVTMPNYAYIGNQCSTSVTMGYDDFNVRVTVSSGQQSQTVYYQIAYFNGLPKEKAFNEITNILPNNSFLYTNFPNPFNPTTQIRYDINETGYVNLKVFNSLGVEVITLVNENKSAGSYIANFDASGLASGIYLYTLTTNNYVKTEKMILMK